MVDWDRVGELRSKGWDWDEIAEDPKVGFHPDSSAGDPGRALRALYHRQRSRRDRQGPTSPSPKKVEQVREKRWTLLRVLYLLVPIVAVWAALAYVAPSPVGLLLPAIPWLALAAAVLAILLIYFLLRADKRWTKVYRTTVVSGVVLGIVVSAGIGLVAVLVVGCPYLPPASTLSSQPAPGWAAGTMKAWQDNGLPVVYFYGATWCPYCSASSWAIWKALTAFGSVTGNKPGYSFGSPEPYQNTPEMILANAQVSSSHVTFQVNEYVYGSDGVFPSTSNCYQSAYVTAYSGGSIPFLVVNGQFIHAGTTIVDPANLQQWEGNGWSTVYGSVYNETGTPWSYIETQACWITAYILKAAGMSTATGLNLRSSATVSQVNSDLAQIS